MICANCGSENPADNLYCGQCSYRLTATAAGAPHYPSRASMLRREFAILGVGLAVLLAAAFGVWYGLYYAKSPVMVVRRFVDADLNGQFSQQQPLIVNRWDAQMSLSAFQAIRRQIGRSPFQGYQVAGWSINGQTAYVTVSIPFRMPTLPGLGIAMPGGTATPAPVAPGAPPTTTLPIGFALTFENGEWRIDASQTFANAIGTLAAVGYAQIAPNLSNLPNLNLPNLNLPNLIPPGSFPNLLNPPPAGPPAGPSGNLPVAPNGVGTL